MKPLDLEPIKAREKATTKGPWRAVVVENRDEETECAEVVWTDDEDSEEPEGPVVFTTEEYEIEDLRRPGVTTSPRGDAEFVAHARQDVPALVAEVEQLRAENVRLLDTLHVDHTGLARALEEVRLEARRRMWVVDGRGSYEWDDDDYRREAGLALESVIERATAALTASGNLAHAHCCGRQSIAENVARAKAARTGAL